jgi:CYTH domain-containing protein
MQEIEVRHIVIGFNPNQIKKYNPETFTITQQYLKDKEKKERRVRKVIYFDNSSTCYLTKEIKLTDTKGEETEIDISEEDYRTFLKKESHPHCKRVLKVRYEFNYRGRLYQLDVHKNHLVGLNILRNRVESEEAFKTIVFPPELALDNVTERKEFSTRFLAQFGVPSEPA